MPGYGTGDATDAANTLINDIASRDQKLDAVITELRGIKDILARLLAGSVLDSDGPLPATDGAAGFSEGVQ